MLRAALGTPLDRPIPQLNHLDLPYQADGGEEWGETQLDAYRTNITRTERNLRDHRDCPTLTGHEDEFTSRCRC